MMNKLFKKYKWLKKYWIEIILLTSAFLITVISLAIFIVNNQPKDEETTTDQTEISGFASSKYLYRCFW